MRHGQRAADIEEIEKAFAGTGTDLSGVKTEMTGTMLTWMQDREADGCIFIGPPDAAKSAIAKATENTAGIPTIAFDLAAMQSSLVGASGDRLRTALKIVDAVSQGRALFIATCNSIASLPPELRRRFTLGTFFFDLPTPEERATIWKIYERKYSVSGERPIGTRNWIWTIDRPLPRHGGKARLFICPRCQYARRALYAWKLNPSRPHAVFISTWQCRLCARLRYASELKDKTEPRTGPPGASAASRQVWLDPPISIR